MDLGLKGKVALVTGGSKGIGRASAIGLAAEGASVAISARKQSDLDAAADDIRSRAGAEVLTVSADCTVGADVTAMVRTVLERFGRIDILVNSIGAARVGSFLKLSDQDWQESLALKLMGQIRVAREVFPHMQKQRWGRIINVIGTHAAFPEAHAMPAGVANAGLMNFTKALAELGARDGVLVNGVHPGTVRTDRLAYLLKQGMEYDLKQITLGRFAEPEELASVIVFLASERSSYMCGSFVTVDGGQIKCL